MLFNFLSYIRPTWYFNLKPKKNFHYFPSQEALAALGYDLEVDEGFLSEVAKTRELAWRAFQRGFIHPKESRDDRHFDSTKLPIQDEYRFLRKNFHKAWVYYVFLFRMLQFHNPLKEIRAFTKTRSIKREIYSKQHFTYPEYDEFQSPILNSKPLVSVIIPTLNRYEYLKEVLRDLERQTYANFEVLVVDQTDDFQASFYQGWHLNLTFWHQEDKALWKARNSAITLAKGDYILLYDDDSLIQPDWICEHLKTLDFFDADISSGVSISVIGGEVPKHYGYFRWSDQLDTGNVMIKKVVFNDIGLFDRQFEKQRMGDGEFGLRAYLAGYKNISNPKAKRVHLKVSQGGLRQMGSWDAFRTSKFFAPRPIPSVLYLTRSYFGSRASLYYIMIHILPSVVPIRFKSNKILKFMTFVLFPILLPLIIFQVGWSWRLSSQKLSQGPLIDALL